MLPLAVQGCMGRGGSGGSAAPVVRTENTVELIASVSASSGARIRQGDPITFSYELKAGAVADSVVLSLGESSIRFDGNTCTYTPSDRRTGRVAYKITAYSNGRHHARNGEYVVLAAAAPKKYGFRAVKTFPHDKTSYTQGLFVRDGQIYESTGEYGRSTIRRVDIATGRVLASAGLDRKYFAEGAEMVGGKIYQLTWREGKAFVYDPATLRTTGEFDYRGEGWGLASDGTRLYMSDGSSTIKIIDPATFKITGSISVCTDSGPVEYLNEMEWIDGQLWANVYRSMAVVRIDPATGAVAGVIDFSGIISETDVDYATDVFNGIAYDAASGKIYVTGKNWNKLYQVEVIAK